MLLPCYCNLFKISSMNISYYIYYSSWYQSSLYKLSYQSWSHLLKGGQYWGIMMVHIWCLLRSWDKQVPSNNIHGTLDDGCEGVCEHNSYSNCKQTRHYKSHQNSLVSKRMHIILYYIKFTSLDCVIKCISDEARPHDWQGYSIGNHIIVQFS